jgi:uncharacterized membrane protein YphA (DoxX/SURF4 family)
MIGSRREERRLWIARALEMLIGAIFLFVGVLKGYQPVDFEQQIADYQIVPHPALIRVIAWTLIPLEIAVGSALVIGYRRRFARWLTLLMLAGFTILLGWAWWTGVPENCGCFGAWAERTPAIAIVQDLGMIVALVLSGWLAPGESVSTKRWRGATVLGLTLLGLGGTILSSQSARQSKDPLTRLSAGATTVISLQGLAVEGIPALDLGIGRHLVVLLDTGCSHCQESVPALNHLQEELAREAIPLLALCPNRTLEIEQFRRTYGATFPVGRIEQADFTRLFARGRPPRLLLVEAGRVLQIWDETVPPDEEVRSRLASRGEPR